jgi:AAA domain
MLKVSKAVSSRAPLFLPHGAEGRGKTTLMTKFKNTVAFLLEHGLPRGADVDAVENVHTFEDVIQGLRDIYTDPGDYKTVGIDTLDALEPLIHEHVCKKNNWKSIETPPYGRGFTEVDPEWRRFLRAVTSIRDRHGMTIVMTCHTSIERVDDPRVPTYTSYQPRLHKRARGLVMDACDIVGFLAEDLNVVTDGDGFRERTRARAGNQRYLFVEGCPAFAAKYRYGMPAKIPVPLDFDITELSKFWS